MKTQRNIFILILIFIIGPSLLAQEYSFDTGKSYVIGEIEVTGNTSFGSQTIVAYSGLRKDDIIKIPGEKISNAIKKLWRSNLFSSIDIYASRFANDTVFLEIELSDLPELNTVKIQGVKKASLKKS